MEQKLKLRSYLRKYYQLIICFMIVVFLINEATLLKTYRDHVNANDIINQAGRQRMYSQKIAKLTLNYQNGDYFALQELKETVARWSLTHKSFMDNNSSLSRFYYSSKLIRENFNDLNLSQKIIEKSVEEIIEGKNEDHSIQIESIMNEERNFLALMDVIVNQMELESREIHYKVTMITFMIGIGVILIIGLVIYLYLVPTINKLEKNEILLTDSINRKEALLTEIHHRVKNNLSFVSGMIQLQLMNNNYSKNTFQNAIDRVQSIANIHEFLYSEKKYSTVRIDQYVHELIDKLKVSYPEIGEKIRVDIIADDIVLNTEKTIPLSLLLNELITNSLKHAFKETELGRIEIVLLKYDERNIFFKYLDNGKGSMLALKDTRGIGMKLIETFAQQLNCELEISYTPSFNLITTLNVN